MFTQLLNFISSQDLVSQSIDYTLLTIAFFSFYVLVSKIIKVVKTNESERALVKVKL